MIIPSAPLLALGALFFDLALGPIRTALKEIPAPPMALARLALTLTRRLDRPNRTAGTLKARGAALAVVMVAGAVAAGFGLQMLAEHLPFPFGLVLVGLMLWGCVRAHLPLARLRAGMRGLGAPDGAAKTRAMLEQTAISFVHFIVSPLFWFFLAGPPGALGAAAAWAVERAAHEADRGSAFGTAARGLLLATSWIPAVVADLVLALASIVVPRGRPLLALRQGWGNAGLGQTGVVAALAGGLGVALPGRRSGAEGQIWFGDGTAKVGRNDLLRATWLYLAALLILAGLLVGWAVVLLA